MVNQFFLSTQSKALSIQHEPVSLNIVCEYLKESIIADKNNLEIEINSVFNHQYGSFNTFGAARLEILFYEKTSSEAGREQITLYGVVENIHFQLASFTLLYDTSWLDKDTHHHDDRYFDSIIVDGSGSSPIIPSSAFDLSIRSPSGVLVGHCSVMLRFTSELQKRWSPTVPATVPVSLPISP